MSFFVSLLSPVGLFYFFIFRWGTWNRYDLMHVHSVRHLVCFSFFISFLLHFALRLGHLGHPMGLVSLDAFLGLALRAGRCSWQGGGGVWC